MGADRITPAANTEMMNLHLAKTRSRVTASAIAVVTCDGAGWHQTKENVWDCQRRNKLGDLVWNSYGDIFEPCKTA